MAVDPDWERYGGVADAGPYWASSHGIAGVPFNSADQHSAPGVVTDPPTVGQHIIVTDLIFSVDTSTSVTFTEETSGTVVAGPFYLPANAVIQLTPRGRLWKLPTANKRLQVQTGVAAKITVDAGYFSG